MFATVIIVLPSKFTGGAVYLSHNGKSTIYDCSSPSDFQTTTMAWYTDITHEVKPVTSGYRLALSYSLLHTTNHPRPTVSVNSTWAGRLRHVLKSWFADGAKSSPEKILYILDHKYSEAGLRGENLKGTDAQMVAHLALIAEECGFKLGLANVECRQHGSNNCFHEYVREEDVDFDPEGNGVEVEMSITNFVDMDGDEIMDEFEIDDVTETLPGCLEDMIISYSYDKQENDGYMGNEPGMLERFYRRTVLIIWPIFADSTIRQGGDVYADACEDLMAEADEIPDENCKHLLRHILRHFQADAETVEAVCQVALLWEDVALVKHLMELCASKHLDLIEDDHMEEAMLAFGVDATTAVWDIVLAKQKQNASRFTLLDEIAQLAERLYGLPGEIELEPYGEQIMEWVGYQRMRCIFQLQRLRTGDQEHLISGCDRHGGIEFLRDVVILQVKQLASDARITNFAQHISAENIYKDDDLGSVTKAGIADDLQNFVKGRSASMQVADEEPPTKKQKAA